MIQYIYNNIENEKMKILLFFTNYGYNLKLKELYLKELLLLQAINNIKRLQVLHQQLIEDMKFINQIMGKYYDKRYMDVLS